MTACLRNLTIIAGCLLGAVLVCVGVFESQVNSAQEPAGEKVLKSESPLVVLDVVVTDKKGQPVSGLKSSDFTVFEKDEQMTLQSFEEYRVDQAPPPAPPAEQALVPNVFTNIPDTRSDGPLNVLLMDALNTAMADQMYVREQMLEYVKKVPQGTRIAIFGLSNRLYMLQNFTTDPAILKADVQMFRAEKVSLPGGSDMGTIGPHGLFEKNLAFRGAYTRAAVEDLARYLSGLPGRKNLIWFAGSFPLRAMPDGDRENRFGAMANFADDEKWIANLLTRDRVAVYPIDARGLFTNPEMHADVAVPEGAERLDGRTPGEFQQSEVNFLGQRADDKIAMNMLAERTGGKAFYDTNGLKEAVQEAINDGSNYYTLAYAPANRKWDGRYRSIRVTVAESGVHLFYRQGYFAYDPNAPRPHGAQTLPMSVMDSAMLLGEPNPTQIPFMVKVVPTAGTANTLPPTNQPNVKKMKPPYRRYTVWYDIDLRNVAFTGTPGGIHRGSLEFEILLYNSNGHLMNAIKEIAKAKLPAAGYESRAWSGLKFHQNIDAPAKGEYFLRIGVHDVASDRVGAVEVPLAAIQPESISNTDR
jgi:VWFA-related protein